MRLAIYAYPSLDSMRGRSALRKQFPCEIDGLFRFAGQLTDQVSVHPRGTSRALSAHARHWLGVKSCRGSCQLPLQANR